MDPHLDDELKEYLRLIDATVKSATSNHISPQKMSFAQLPQQFKANEFLQNIILLNNNCEDKEIKSVFPQRKKPEMLDDSISDWNNIGSQQTTLESPKSQEDIKDLCQGLQGISCGVGQSSHHPLGQNVNQLGNMIAPQQFSQKLQRYFPEQQMNEQQHPSCLCSLDQSSKPSRNIIVQLNLQDDIEQFLSFARTFGDIQNVDRHKYQYEKIVVLSFYNITSSIQAYQAIPSSTSNMIKVSYLNDFNDFDYIDYMLISNANSFNQKLVLDYLGWFGKIFEYSSINSKLVVRYFDVRSLKEIDRLIKLLEKDRKSFVYLHRAHFPEVEEKFILELLKNIFIFSKENTTDIMLKNTRVKSTKQSNSQQQHLSYNQQNQKTNQGEISQQQQQQIQSILPISPNNASSPPLPNYKESNYSQRTNQQQYFASNSSLNVQQKLPMNNDLNNFFNFEDSSSTKHYNENVYPNNFISQQKGMQQQTLQQFGGQQRRELSEICDYQNFFIPTQQQQFNSKQNQFVGQSSQNTLSNKNENCMFSNFENENIPLNQLSLQQKKLKKMNPNANNFSTLINYNSNNSHNNGSNNSNCSVNILQNNCSTNVLQQSNCQANLSSLQQSLSNLHNSQDNGTSQQQIQYLQQISQSSSSSLTSTNFPQFTQQPPFNNYNSMRMSQDENPFSASSLRMSFDNNPIYQTNNSFYSNNNNTSTSNINLSNAQNINSMSYNHGVVNGNNNCSNNQQQSRSIQNNQQTQFMNLLNCNNQYMSDMRFNNNPNVNGVDQFDPIQNTTNQNNFNSTSHNKQFNNSTMNYTNSQSNSIQQSQNKISTILGSNGAKSQNSNQNFQVNLDIIASLKDRRATIMVRNIPNRYNQEDFLRIIDINFKGLYDFVYLPMDFKNHCNIGYAFINFIDAKHIIPFFKEFNGKRWEMIRSEKVCYICYARIQGRNELIAHFKKSGVMSAMVDKSFKPLILPNPQLDLQIFQQ